jgi:L-ascorbate metabolism protein UlaG (beta-lactamase superfamily)
MAISRRSTLLLGASALAGLGMRPRAARAQAADTYAIEGGELTIHPVEHASLVMVLPGMVVHVDPVGGAEPYAQLPPPSLILVTHEHGDHFDVPTLATLAGETTRLLTTPAVHGMLPAELQARATAIANGESTTANDIAIDAIPA